MIQNIRIHSVSPTHLSSGSSKSGASAVVVCTALLPLLPSAIPPETAAYFHGKITREQAEELLYAHGVVEGLFLLRESVNRNFVISICHASRVHHYNVERQLDGWYRIQSGPRFVGPIEVVHHHTAHLDGFLTLARFPLKRKYGVFPLALQGLHMDELEQKLRLKAAEMGLKGQSVTEALSGPMRDHFRHLVLKDMHICQPWYHHTIKRREAERRLIEDGNQEGAFLVRFRKEDGSFVLSLCHQMEPKHYKIEEHLDRWSIEGGHYFETLMEMIDHYHHRQDGLLCKLRRPVWAPSFTRSRSGSNAAVKKETSSNFENSGVQTAMTGAVFGWNGSQSLPSLCSMSLGTEALAPHSNSEKVGRDDLKAKQDLISFADWPNVTRLLASGQLSLNTTRLSLVPSALHLATTGAHAVTDVPVTPTNPVADPLTALTPTPTALSHGPPRLVKRLSTDNVPVCRPGMGFRVSSSNPSNSSENSPCATRCLQPTRIGSVASGARITDEVNAAIAEVVSKAFRAVRGSTNSNAIHENGFGPHSDTERLLPQFGSDRSLAETTTTTIELSVPDFSAQTLHFPPILDTPWEEPEGSEDFVQANNNTTARGSTATAQAFTSGTTVPPTSGTNPFLSMLTSHTPCESTPNPTVVIPNSRSNAPPTSHSPDVSTFCSAACCQSRPVQDSIRNAWATALGPDNAQLIYDELPPSNLLLNSDSVILKERLGGGNFGHVVRGIYRTPNGQEVPVAVKTLRPNQIANAGEREILAEARTMAQLKHRHIVRLIGVCKEEQFMLVLELAPLGPINKYLKKHPDVPVHTLTELMYQVSLGMAYLESCKFVHRDLAARNVLLVTRYYAKISDFGMSKALNFGSDYYRAATAGKWPLKWYAPECIYYFRFDSKSDVWSYGITLWEVYSYGDRPYRNMKGAEILSMLDQGLRLSKPSRCPDSIYVLMQQCWHFDGIRRPTFAELVLSLAKILKQMSAPICATQCSPEQGSTIIANGRSRLSVGTSGSGGSGANSGASDGISF